MNRTLGAPCFARKGSGHAGVDSSAVREITPGNAVPGLYSVNFATLFPSLSSPSLGELAVFEIAPAGSTIMKRRGRVVRPYLGGFRCVWHALRTLRQMPV